AGAPLGAGDSAVGTAFLGVAASDLSPSFRAQFGISAFRGAAVTTVVSGSPANIAGLRPGDAIVEIGGRPIEFASDLTAWVASARPGQRVEVTYYRGNRRQTTAMTLARTPEVRDTRRPASSSSSSTAATTAGGEASVGDRPAPPGLE